MGFLFFGRKKEPVDPLEPIGRLTCRYEFTAGLYEDKRQLFAETLLYAERLCKITAPRLIVDKNRKNDSQIVCLSYVTLLFPLEAGGCLAVTGNLKAAFYQPYGAHFIVTSLRQSDTDFATALGTPFRIEFNANGMISTIEQTEEELGKIVKDSRFLFRIDQFDDFMEIFGYYQKLSSELNNGFAFLLSQVSAPYSFLPVDVKGYQPDPSETMVDDNDVILGYRLSPSDLYEMKEEVKDNLQTFVDVVIHEPKNILGLLGKQRSKGNLYLSLDQTMSEASLLNNARLYEVVKISREGENYRLSGRLHGHLDRPRYLCAYDMGQKIKLDSIGRSLQLIKQGGSGPAAELLSYLIGEEEIPNLSGLENFDVTALRKDKALGSYLHGLNDSQAQAFLKAIDGSPVTVIKGPPGTGKTYVINALVQYVTKVLHEKVIISSQTHVAIDNVLDELMSNRDMVIPNRITNRENKYAAENLDATIYRLWAKNFANFNAPLAATSPLAKQIGDDMAYFQGEKTVRYVENTEPQDYDVIGVTTTSAALGGRRGAETLKGFDWLVIDEVSKCPITEVLRYLPYVKKLILVGDDFQLPPLMEFSREDVEHLPSFDADKFEKLRSVYESSVFASTLAKAVKSNRLVLLNENYRSLPGILKAYNIFYDNSLISRRLEVKPEKVHFDEGGQYFEDKDVAFIEVKNGKEVTEAGSTSRYNVEEAKATAYFLQYLLDHTLNRSKVSVAAIFPYGDQIKLFTAKYRDLINQARQSFKSFDVDTVDAFQGKESDIVLVDTVVTDTSRHNFLEDFRRINVSLSRAKDKLFIFGNSASLSSINMSVSNSSDKRHYFYDIISTIRHETGRYVIYDEGKVSYETEPQA